MTKPFNEDVISEREYIGEFVKACDECSTDYVTGFLVMNELNPNSDLNRPIYHLHRLLVEQAELNPREAISLIDNAIYALLNGGSSSSVV